MPMQRPACPAPIPQELCRLCDGASGISAGDRSRGMRSSPRRALPDFRSGPEPRELSQWVEVLTRHLFSGVVPRTRFEVDDHVNALNGEGHATG